MSEPTSHAKTCIIHECRRCFALMVERDKGEWLCPHCDKLDPAEYERLRFRGAYEAGANAAMRQERAILAAFMGEPDAQPDHILPPGR